MKAYELAKAQQAYSPPTLEEIIKQQADRIAELEKEADRLSNHADELRKVHADRIAELEKELKRTKFVWNLAENEIENKDRRIKDLTIKLNTKAIKVAELEKSAEPVAWIKKDTLIFLGNYEFGSITIQVQKQKDDEFDIPLYTTPQIKELSDGCGNCHACLVGVMENNIPVTSQRMIVCSDCGNKRCPKASNHRHKCTGSNEVGQHGSIYTAPRGLSDEKIEKILYSVDWSYDPVLLVKAIEKEHGIV